MSNGGSRLRRFLGSISLSALRCLASSSSRTSTSLDPRIRPRQVAAIAGVSEAVSLYDRRSLSSSSGCEVEPMKWGGHAGTPYRMYRQYSTGHPSQPSRATGMLTIEQLQAFAASGEIDTVVVAFTDMYGRLMGKRFSADFFLEHTADSGSHACNYLLCTDMDMTPVQGFKFASWEKGYGDFELTPDLGTLRRASWLDRTAMVQCDVHVGGTAEGTLHTLAPHAPRTILRAQVDAAREAGLAALTATELEYFLFRDSYERAHAKRYHDLKPAGWHVEDYHILQGTREEFFTAPARRHLRNSGVPVESSKGEFGLGQHELNVKYSTALTMADNHAVYKQCLKEVAEGLGCSVTFMAKPFSDQAGSSCHIHMSLWDAGLQRNLFRGDQMWEGVRCSDTFRWFLGGWMAHCRDLMVLYAPTVNAYKRLQAGSWAPTRVAWSVDNRTSPFRVVGSGNSLRIECRLPGADCNPYLGIAAALASGVDGVQNKIEPPPVLSGDVYKATHLVALPSSLEEAVQAFEASEFVRRTLGTDVQEHYAHFYRTETRQFQSAVTDWEKQRYFEQI